MPGADGHGYRTTFKTLLHLLPALLAGPAFAGEQRWDTCFHQAGLRYHVAPSLLRAIALVESGLDPQARNHNRNGSRDIGLMQINTRWLPDLEAYGIEEEDLWRDPCLNIHVGAWILAQEVQRFGYGWEAVGAYHAGPSDNPSARRRRTRYALRVHRALADPAVARCRHDARGVLDDACPLDAGPAESGRVRPAGHPAPRGHPEPGRDLYRVSGMPPTHTKTSGAGG